MINGPVNCQHYKRNKQPEYLSSWYMLCKVSVKFLCAIGKVIYLPFA